MRIMRSIRRFEHEFDRKAEQFAWKHPFAGALSVFVGLPVFILLSVCISTAALVFPMAWILGWM